MVKYGLILLLVAIMFASCNKDSNVDCENYDYSSCNTIEPDEGELSIIVTKQTVNSMVPVSLYKGKYGVTATLIYSDTVSEVELKFNVMLNEDYYAIAKYESGGKAIYAIDGTYFKKVGQTTCDSTCWKIKGAEIDIRLKN